MSRNGGVGVYVRPHWLTGFSNTACAAELNGLLHPLSHIPPPTVLRTAYGGSACGDDGIYIAAIRVRPPQERQK